MTTGCGKSIVLAASAVLVIAIQAPLHALAGATAPAKRAGCLALAFLCLFSAALTAPASAEEPEAPAFRAWTGDLDSMEERRLVRILVPYSKTIYFIDGGDQLGTAVELGRALETWLNKKFRKTASVDRFNVAFVPVARGELIDALVDGRGDIVAADLTVTPSRRERIDFSDPLASGVSEVLVTGPASPPVSSLDDLGGRTIYVRSSSSFHEHLGELNAERLRAGKPEIVVAPIDENLEDEDILEMVNAGLLPWAVADRFTAAIWAEVFDQIKVRDDIAISEGGDIALGIRKDSPLLRDALSGFVKEHKIGTTFGNILRKRYYRSDRMVRRAYEPAESAKFQAMLLLFERYADQYDFDPLLLAAQGYQESQLDQSRRSPRGAVGIMQLLPSTAADKAVGIKGIAQSAERNIEAGAKYMRHLSQTYVDGDDLAPLDRMLLTLAAYNAGPGNLRKFRRAAADLGLNADVWFGNVENGAAKIVGRETVQYVSNIYKYYIAYSMYLEQSRVRQEVVENQSADGSPETGKDIR
ncbi:transporter substrate-binding domain-containing protein [Mesorhizobium sp. ZMM04-5]|uniref:Transporter substrate-binding domain-containing protein n=1 Tax=Mesorhizobium marinum TaxID=3228790 RepID=A0ABV3R599_9HYPH